MTDVATRQQVRPPTAEEQALKQKWLDIWHKDRAQVLLQHPFTASLALHLDLVPVVDSRIATAATDGRKVFFNPLFLQTLERDERRFVLAHEVWHCVAGQLERRHDRDPHLWNLAIDHEVNNLLIDDGFVMPQSGVLFPAWSGKSAEQVYDLLKQKTKRYKSHPPGFDQHQLPRELTTDQEPLAQPLVQDPDYQPGIINEELRREWRENLVAATQNTRTWGNLTHNLQAWIQQRTRPQLRWQDLLRQFVQRSYGGSRQWFPPSRRHLYRKLYLPSIRSNHLRIWVALDTSGSTYSLLPMFLAELSSLLRSFDQVELTLIECDTEIKRITHYSEHELQRLESMEFSGFGGTSLIPPFELASEENTNCLVYLTDGYGPAPRQQPCFPVLWGIPDDGKKPAEWGETVVISDNQSYKSSRI